MKLTFLGTGDSIPTAKRNHTAILLTYRGENILVDCGEGTQRQFRKAKISYSKITKILLTHKHGDHSLGLMGLLSTMGMMSYKKTLEIYGPRGIKKFISNLFKVYGFKPAYKIVVKEVSGKFFENDDFYLEAEGMTHSSPVNAYSFVKKGNLRIDRDKLKKTGLPNGPLLKKLKEGKNITHKGKKFLAKNLTYQENGKKVSFVLDTTFNNKISGFVKGADVLVCEATFSEDLASTAREHGHMTSKEASNVAKKAKVGKLLVTHISQRHENNMEGILKEVKKGFKNASLVKDLDVVEIS